MQRLFDPKVEKDLQFKAHRARKVLRKAHLKVFEDDRWSLHFVFPGSLSQDGLGLLHSSLSEQPARRLWDKPAQSIQVINI